MNTGYILGNICEFLVFAYFANTSFYPRKNYVLSNIISLFGYTILCAISFFGKASVSILSFFIINAALLVYCYNVKLKNAVFYSLILDTMSCIGEYIFAYIVGYRYGRQDFALTSHQIMIIILGGKFIYFFGIAIIKHFIDSKMINESDTQTILVSIPVMTILCLTVLMSIEISTLVFLMLCAVFMLINFVAFYINAGLNAKNRELKILQEEYNRNKTELSEYQLLAEKYENTRIMRHDFHKQLEVLKKLIAEDSIQAGKYMREIRFSQRELDYAQYTDNKILNILLDQKLREGHGKGVEMHIHSKSPVLSFISDIDTVAIFSNMLDNAMEAAQKARNKEIYVDLYTVNNSYSAVRVENYTDSEPIVLDGLLGTQKKDAGVHGIGIKSINNALKKYNSELTWTYDKDQKFFRAVALICVPGEKNSV